MTDTFSPTSRAIFAKNVLAHVASLDADGGPNVTPVWVELDGEDIVINTALGRAKARNLAADARVAVSLTDPDDPYVCIAVRGTVVGFRMPDFVQGINVPGCHAHFLTADRQAGGHVLDFTLDEGTLELAVCSRIDLRLPKDAGAFKGIDFSRDRTEELDKAEK